MANKRIYYAVHQVGIQGDSVASYTFGSNDEVHGVQSVGIATNFNLEQVFELGQVAIYENIENLPDVEVTLSKVLDGYPLIYHMATIDATSPTLTGRSNEKCFFGLAVFPDTNDSSTGNPPSVVGCSGMFISSVTYNFPLDDNFSEDTTLIGNDKVWRNQSGYGQTLNPNLPDPSFPGQFTTNTDSPQGSGGVNRRENLDYGFLAASGEDVNNMVADADCTVLPPEVFGITASGTNEEQSDGSFGAHVSNITVSVDFGREEINELGRKGPYHRFITFPVEVTCEIEVTSSSGDMVSATEAGIYTTGTDDCDDGGNLANRTIRIATCEGTRVYLGTKNKLSSVNYTGGDAGGGNVSVTYSYSTFNDFTVLHDQDPNALSATWWANKGDFLIDLT